MSPLSETRSCTAVAEKSIVMATRRGPGAMRHGRGHGWMMMICCIPMVVIAVALVATGTVGAGFLITAAACVAMMSLMGGMHHGGADDAEPDRLLQGEDHGRHHSSPR